MKQVDLFRNKNKGRSCSAPRSILRVVVLKPVAPIGLVLPARYFAALGMTGLYFIVIPEQA